MYSKQQPCCSSVLPNKRKKKVSGLEGRKILAAVSGAEHLALFYSVFPSPWSEIKINAGERVWYLVLFAAGCD